MVQKKRKRPPPPEEAQASEVTDVEPAEEAPAEESDEPVILRVGGM